MAITGYAAISPPAADEIVRLKSGVFVYDSLAIASAIRGVQNISLDPVEKDEVEIFHAGAGNESLVRPGLIRWEGKMTFLGGRFAAELARLKGITDWAATSGTRALRMQSEKQPTGFIYLQQKDESLSTVLSQVIIPEVRLEHIPFKGELDWYDEEIAFKSHASPIIVDGGVTLVLESFSGTGIQTAFTLAHAALELFESAVDPVPSTKAIFVKVRDSSTAPWRIVTAGYSIASSSLTFSEAPPTGTDNVKILYGYIAA